MSDTLKPISNTMLPITAKELPAYRLGAASSESDKERVCKGFESYFLLNMLKDMDKIAHISKKNNSEQTYMSVVYEKVADFLADHGIGVKEMLMKYADKGNAKVLSENGDKVGK